LNLQRQKKLLKKQGLDEKIKGESTVLAKFVIHEQIVYGIKVTKGKVSLADKIEVFRNDNLIGKSKIQSLQIRSNPVKEAKKGQEAGILINPNLDIKIGDVIKYIL